MPQSAPPEPTPIDLTALTTVIGGAADRQVPLAVAYVDHHGHPHLSPRGTVQVVGPEQLALWARTPGLPDAIAVNPHVALLYLDMPGHTLYQLTGRARGVDDPVFREQVFANSPAREQAQDPDRSGTAVRIDVDTVRGRDPNGMLVMDRPRPTDEHRSPVAAAAARDGMVLTQMLIVADIERSVRFYRDVLGATVVRDEAPAMLRFAGGWLILNVGGGPTPDKPTVTVAPPDDADRVSAFLNVRVADVHAVHQQWTARGAQFLTAPLDNHGAEIRCYLRDPDGYLIEVGQTTAPQT